jgi:hypothetical protein
VCGGGTRFTRQKSQVRSLSRPPDKTEQRTGSTSCSADVAAGVRVAKPVSAAEVPASGAVGELRVMLDDAEHHSGMDGEDRVLARLGEPGAEFAAVHRHEPGELPVVGHPLGHALHDHGFLGMLGAHHTPRVRGQVARLAGTTAGAEVQGAVGPDAPDRSQVW